MGENSEEGGKLSPEMSEINAILGSNGYADMWRLMDVWLVIQVKQLDCIFNWRLQVTCTSPLSPPFHFCFFLRVTLFTRKDSEEGSK